ncbi:MAG: response regulator, partial [Thermodesulfobacteriota bacterium]|nr:response regulator [Thermodesulfobacteriota bacterium]
QIELEEGLAVLCIARDITERKEIDMEREITIELLRLLNSPDDLREIMKKTIRLFKDFTECDAVGIRLREDEDFPYFEVSGFSEEFIKAENSICIGCADGQIKRDIYGKAVLKCICGKVISRGFDASDPFFTYHGSFWTNSIANFLEANSMEGCNGDSNRCLNDGYKSMALIPLRSGGETFGLVQLNYKRNGWFKPKLIALFERFCDNVAITVSQRIAEKERVRMAIAVEQADETFVITGIDDKIEYVNPAFEYKTGYSQKEVIGKSPLILFDGEQGEAMYKMIRDIVKNGGKWSGRTINKIKDGTFYELNATVSPVRDRAGRITHFVFIGLDVTHEISLERQLKQAQKMEALGTLAGGIAHDFNNILSAVIGYTELALGRTHDYKKVQSYMKGILKAGKRAKNLVKQIVTFSRQAESDLKPIDISPIVNEALKFLRSSMPSTIEIRQNIKKDQGMVLADPTQIYQVAINLCTNAAHAMREKGGILNVDITRVDINSEKEIMYWECKPGPYLKMTFKDSGSGMDSNVIEKIFDPYFTTKGTGEGTGLGLSVVHGIIRKHGGVIKVESEIGKGSSFNILLPYIDNDTIEHKADDFAPIKGGCERILFVDDEDVLVDLTRNTLEELGYEVVAKTSSIEALELFRSQSDSFDVVITDMTMPNITGLGLAKELLKIKPQTPIILCTGFSEMVTEDQVKKVGIREFIMKPILKRDLAESIRRVLD